ncbi:hypothetical protein RSSM_05251 [Rhodopirellula sallentina SM41]|uniref:Uncharacterized protein n=1 Tax=Rhodopirellula sallentina SM41 TaxID=1263870 RepID=M5UBA7_9BACT|nr:hypothetical protein RSSM_05251 [Rhodopirellula sallentina SM41]
MDTTGTTVTDGIGIIRRPAADKNAPRTLPGSQPAARNASTNVDGAPVSRSVHLSVTDQSRDDSNQKAQT